MIYEPVETDILNAIIKRIQDAKTNGDTYRAFMEAKSYQATLYAFNNYLSDVEWKNFYYILLDYSIDLEITV